MRILHISCGHGDPLVGKLLLKKVLRDILLYQSQRHILLQPVTRGILLAIHPTLAAWLGEHDFLMIWAPFTLAFYGFLHCSEFTYSGVHNFHPQFDLGTNCVPFYPSLVYPQHIVVTHKSDFSHQGQPVVIAKAPGTVCVVSAHHITNLRYWQIPYSLEFWPHCAYSQKG